MNFLKNTFSKELISKDEIAELLKTNKTALEQFEKMYGCILDNNETPGNFFDLNSRQASKINRSRALPEKPDEKQLGSMINRIVDELLVSCGLAQPSANQETQLVPVSNAEIVSLPESLRPQLTGSLYKSDLGNIASFVAILDQYKRYTETGNKQWYYKFRQGLDILDLDPITYEIIGMNKNSMGYWFQTIKDAALKHGFFKIPVTKIVKVPLPILQLTRLEYGSLTPTTLKIVDDFCMKAFELDVNKTYFIKTGTYSSKFDFRNAKVSGENEVRELGEYLLFIHYQALSMASPLARDLKTGKPRCIFGVSTTNEWVVREYIEDAENNPCIYKGMPLHTEYRVFVDFDTDEVLSIVPYWDPSTMKKRFLEDGDVNSPHQKHDYVIYKMHEETLMKRYEQNKDKVVEEVEKLIPDVSLPGQWSVDIMQNGDDFYIIDMATADTSAFNDSIPIKKRKCLEENWIPRLDVK